MLQVIVSPKARQDLLDIWQYIGKDNSKAADKVQDDLLEAIQELAKMPHMGHKRLDITDKPLRFWNVYTYTIVYREQITTLEVIRVLSGYRDLAQHL